MKNNTYQKIHQALIVLIAGVWFINGFFCKVLNFVPRHRQIVAVILGEENSGWMTILIGLAETAMAIWILAGIYIRFNAIVQIILIAVMNTLEFILVPELLLWGKWNSLFAFLFIVLIYYNEFHLRKKIIQHN